jgi:hypothetical protein
MICLNNDCVVKYPESRVFPTVEGYELTENGRYLKAKMSGVCPQCGRKYKWTEVYGYLWNEEERSAAC